MTHEDLIQRIMDAYSFEDFLCLMLDYDRADLLEELIEDLQLYDPEIDEEAQPNS